MALITFSGSVKNHIHSMCLYFVNFSFCIKWIDNIYKFCETQLSKLRDSNTVYYTIILSCVENRSLHVLFSFDSFSISISRRALFCWNVMGQHCITLTGPSLRNCIKCAFDISLPREEKKTIIKLSASVLEVYVMLLLCQSSTYVVLKKSWFKRSIVHDAMRFIVLCWSA